MQLLHVSDTHLGSSKPGKLRERELDFYEVFDEVIEIAVKERVDAVLHCGDLFDDPRPNPQTYLYAFKSLKKLRDNGIGFLVIAGQHDQPKTSALSPIRVLEEVGLAKVLAVAEPATHVFKLRSNELGITAIPYADPQTMQVQIRGVRKPETARRVLMAHLLLKELNIPGAHLSLAELGSRDYNYVALGDYHLRYKTEYGGTPVVYPGSTEALDYLESGDERFVALIDLSTTDAVVHWVKLSKFRRWLVVTASAYNELLKVLSKVNYDEFAKPPILYAKVMGKDVLSSNPKAMIEHLSYLRDSGKIITYRLETPGVSEDFEEPHYEEPTAAPTLDTVVHNLLKDSKIADYVLNIIKGCDDEGYVETLITALANDQELISRLEKLVRAK